MKKSELRQIIKEEIKKIVKEGAWASINHVEFLRPSGASIDQVKMYGVQIKKFEQFLNKLDIDKTWLKKHPDSTIVFWDHKMDKNLHDKVWNFIKQIKLKTNSVAIWDH